MNRTVISYSQINISHIPTGAVRCLSFNGKEKDYESGLHYYGARYYWSETMTGWLSVDPIADKYPGLSPYNYCAWNPVKLVDPDGMEVVESEDSWKYNTTTGKLTWEDDKGGKTHQSVKMVHNEGGHTVTDNTVLFNGDITEMFDCSVFSPKVDKAIDAGMNIMTGITEAGAAVAFGVGISAISGGTASTGGIAIAAPFVADGGAKAILGIKDLMTPIGEMNAKGNPKHDLMKSMCSDGVGIAASLIKNDRPGLFKTIMGMVPSLLWTYSKYHNATKPIFKGVPQGSQVTY